MPQPLASQHWGDIPQPSCWPILNGGTRLPYSRPGSASMATAHHRHNGPWPCLCHACAVPWAGPGWALAAPGCPGQEWDVLSGGSLAGGGGVFHLPPAVGSGLARAGGGCGSVLPSPCAGRRGEDLVAVVAS